MRFHGAVVVGGADGAEAEFEIPRLGVCRRWILRGLCGGCCSICGILLLLLLFLVFHAESFVLGGWWRWRGRRSSSWIGHYVSVPFSHSRVCW